MASPTKGRQDYTMGLNPNEARLLLLGVLLADKSGKINFEELAQKAPYKNASCASSSYRQARKKFFDTNSHLTASSTTFPTSSPASAESPDQPLSTPKKTPTKRKRGPAGIDTDTANAIGTTTAEGEYPSPIPKAKKQRKSPTKKAAVKTEVGGDQNIDTNPTKSEPELPKPNTTDEVHKFPSRKSLKSEEVDVMNDLDIDGEFTDMERKRGSMKVERDDGA
ncbi:hypothetical protein BJX70DRAFT_394651 [Aspergillus crustosus]